MEDFEEEHYEKPLCIFDPKYTGSQNIDKVVLPFNLQGSKTSGDVTPERAGENSKHVCDTGHGTFQFRRHNLKHLKVHKGA
ncbi:hypothetical protein TNCT_528981 [Trichonephila clavata]|uniref:Uncharacterized protein n=1 Tax=Trichonephila clavata TaxID=2740835 RepID=A0A8X6M077_TRICU|nr:hypothetical protein TNCT_528981 [Trichonephila clavata]